MSEPSHPHPLGVRPYDGGVEAAVLAGHADRVELCLLDPSDDGGWSERRVDLPSRTHGVWHGFVPEVRLGQHYGFRVHGEWSPRRGHRHNPAKLLLDPYARAVVPPPTLIPELFGHTVDADLQGNLRLRDERDSGPLAAHGVVVEHLARSGPSTRPRTPWRDTVIYEAHVRGLTRNLPGVPARLRGSYAGLAHPRTIEYLTGLGVTTVELLPVHVPMPEAHLVRRGLTNYWAYNTLGFFAPNPAYASTGDAVGAVAEFAAMVAALHQAGLEVLLDVVYNHTCEGGAGGPMLSFRGLDAATYYRLDGDGNDIDFTGCGNSLDATQARVVQLVLDSLRYWVDVMDVDGFRFDLASTLARGHNEFHPDHPMLVAMRADPVLAGVKLIAEPWDVGPDGWQTGRFPPPFAEWNDRFRDDVRDFWLPGAARALANRTTGGLRDLGTRIAGSADTFSADRGPLASINFVTAHDGFTLADTCSYERKHNDPNGEGSRDGADNNRSWNHGVEGPSNDPAIERARQRSIRNLLGTLLFSAGVPMLLSGDEFGRSQQGNNNPYSQDNEVSWLNWKLDPAQEQLLATTRYLLALRREFAGVRPETFYSGAASIGSAVKDLTWFGPDGVEMTWQRWEDGGLRTLQLLFADPLLRLPEALPERRVERRAADPGRRVIAGRLDVSRFDVSRFDPGRPDGGRQAVGRADLSRAKSLLMVIGGAPHVEDITLPAAPMITSYELLWDSAEPLPGTPEPTESGIPGGIATLHPDSVRLYRAHSTSPPT